MYRIGVDVGGTNTDGVLMDVSQVGLPERGILAMHKASTSPDVTTGISAAVSSVLKTSGVPPTSISSLTIGTTHFINAVLTRDKRRLKPVAIIRICGPYTRQCPPLADWPKPLRNLVEGHVGYVDGGQEIDGREILPLVEDQILAECNAIKEKGILQVVLCAVYSALDTGGVYEERAATIVRKSLGDGVDVICSKDVGQVGFIERENASILNASILPYARRTIRAFRRAMIDLDLKCPLFLTQNDGTLTTSDKAEKLPIRTFASGQTNSMKGASILAGLDFRNGNKNQQVLVVDIGGTTSDVGVLLPSGFPRQAAAFIDVGGVHTNFAMPDVQSIALGGGSIVHKHPNGSVTVGADSVGHHLTRDALIFGGDILTATDIMVAAGKAKIGDDVNVSGRVSEETVGGAMKDIRKGLELVIDRMKTSPEPALLLLVGGGSILCPDELEGAAEIIRPPFHDVANAVGAAMAQVSGEVDTIEILQGKSVTDVLESLKAQALEKAIAAGADPATTKVVEVTDIPLQYVTNQATRFIVKAVGNLSLTTQAPLVNGQHDEHSVNGNDLNGDIEEEEEERLAEDVPDRDVEVINPETYRPTVDSDRVWHISETDLAFIADGCGVMGTGGGGSPYSPMLMCAIALRDGKRMRVVDPDDVPEESTWMRCGFVGSPSVGSERIQGQIEILTAYKALTQYMGKEPMGMISGEMGGGNGLQPMLLASQLDKPIFDGDARGRAYPQLHISLLAGFGIHGATWPAAMADGIGNSFIMPSAISNKMVETILRQVSTQLGSLAGAVQCPLTRATFQKICVPHSLSMAWHIGQALARCRHRNDLASIPAAILKIQQGRCIFRGKIVAVDREVRAGFTWGSVSIVPLLDEEEGTGHSEDPGYAPTDTLVIPFQNENIYAYTISSSGAKKTLVTVPDLITVMDSQSGAALGTPEYKYGMRVFVMALAAHPNWTKTQEGMKAGGPEMFGLNMDFHSVGEYREPRSVIDEYGPSRKD
ncbi:DUF917-domain-containing protein [Naematelia encephala]|uniref:DUF917-domain-containing protein n=1 Tax=Naematelia encephala TaxID=71784 RepID=A0A1Y2ASK2_9TREE|nr:DUF917-domain-containing protein [Naematelia encephala]